MTPKEISTKILQRLNKKEIDILMNNVYQTYLIHMFLVLAEIGNDGTKAGWEFLNYFLNTTLFKEN